MNELKRSEILLIIVSYVATSHILGFKYGGGGYVNPLFNMLTTKIFKSLGVVPLFASVLVR